MIRILLAIIIIVLLITAKYLNSHSETICKVFATDETKEDVIAALQRYSKACLLYSIIGLLAFLYNHQLIAIAFICLVILTSAVFSSKFAKLIS